MTAGHVDPTLLLLVDGRLPDGAYAHSGGLEAAAGRGRVTDVTTLGAFLRGRLRTTGLVTAALAAAAAAAPSGIDGGGSSSSSSPAQHRPRARTRVQDRAVPDGTQARAPARGQPGHGFDLADLDILADARMPSPATREASRRQGRNLLRAASRAWPSPAYRRLPRRPHHPITLGVVARAIGLETGDAALAGAYGSVTGPAGAAVRLLSLDPLEVHALLAGLADEIAQVASEATAAVGQGEIPASSAPLLEVGAEDHFTWEVRLFAS